MLERDWSHARLDAEPVLLPSPAEPHTHPQIQSFLRSFLRTLACQPQWRSASSSPSPFTSPLRESIPLAAIFVWLSSHAVPVPSILLCRICQHQIQFFFLWRWRIQVNIHSCRRSVATLATFYQIH